MTTASSRPAAMLVNDVRLELIERGTGAPLLFLHPGIGIEPTAPVLDLLSKDRRLIAPSHPGFGNSDLPKDMSTIDDLSYFYLDVMDALDLRDVLLLGVGLGGWIAAEIAIKSCARISHLVMVNAVGVKVGPRESRDIVDIWAITQDELDQLAFFDPARGRRDYASLPEADVLAAARNREATARFGWSPYMHDPKLKGRLHRIRIPTLFLWGTADRILSEAYGRAYCAAIPGARLELIERAGHFPHLEQPEELARRVHAFAGREASGPRRERRAVGD